jgi:sulfur carrier protein ThiS
MDCNGALVSATLFNNHERVNDLLRRYPEPALTKDAKQEALRIACARGFYKIVVELVENGKVVPDEDTIDAACKRKDNIRIMRILRKAG